MIMLGAAALVARLASARRSPDVVDWDETDAAAAALRTRTLVTARLNPPTLDQPVMGSGFVGYAAWMLDPRTAERHAAADGWVATGLPCSLWPRGPTPVRMWRACTGTSWPPASRTSGAASGWTPPSPTVASLSPADAVSHGLALLSELRA